MIAPVAGTEAEEVQSIEDALQLWAQVLPVQAEVALEQAPESALAIEFESGDSFYRAMYWDSLGLISISRDHLQPEDYAIALAHELGHAFGLPHVPKEQRASVMNVGNLDVPPDEVDAAALRALWPACESP